MNQMSVMSYLCSNVAGDADASSARGIRDAPPIVAFRLCDVCMRVACGRTFSREPLNVLAERNSLTAWRPLRRQLPGVDQPSDTRRRHVQHRGGVADLNDFEFEFVLHSRSLQ